MRAELRDAKRAEAAKRGTSEVRPEKAEAKCYVCGVEMPNLGGRAKGGICQRCFNDARAKRDLVVASRKATERAKQVRKDLPEWKPRHRKKGTPR